MVFQNCALYPHLSVYQNIGFALENRKIDKAERDQRIRAAATVLSLATFTVDPARGRAGCDSVMAIRCLRGRFRWHDDISGH
jgi:ABC-type proline/glycine betaine transport system ATPase subunit